MSATLALRQKIEALIAADTSSGGLAQGPAGTASLAGGQGSPAVYHQIAPSTEGRAFILYSIEEKTRDGTNFLISDLTVTLTIYVRQDQVFRGAGQTGDAGQTLLDTMRDRLRTVLDLQTPATTDGWIFQPLMRDSRASGPAGKDDRELTRTVEVYKTAANKAKASPATGITVGSIVSGLGCSITGKLFTAGPRFGYTSGSGASTEGLDLEVHCPYAIAIAPTLGVAGVRRELDRHQRRAPTFKDCQILLSFFPVVRSAAPILPVGEVYSLTFTLYNSVTIALASGVTALVTEAPVTYPVAGTPSGRYTIYPNGPFTTTFGPP